MHVCTDRNTCTPKQELNEGVRERVPHGIDEDVGNEERESRVGKWKGTQRLKYESEVGVERWIDEAPMGNVDKDDAVGIKGDTEAALAITGGVSGGERGEEVYSLGSG